MTPDQALAREIALLKRAQKDPTFGWPVIKGGAA